MVSLGEIKYVTKRMSKCDKSTILGKTAYVLSKKFTPKDKICYADNIHVSMTNSISVFFLNHLKSSLEVTFF